MELTNIENPKEHVPHPKKEMNNLFPVFFKLDHLAMLIVGGGYVGMEKLSAVISNSPAASLTLVATSISEEIKTYCQSYPNIKLIEQPFDEKFFHGHDLVIVAINEREASSQIHAAARRHNKLVNVADQPALCDFYLSSVVKKGNLKIAISTNGKSPTIAKRLKETLQDTLPAKLEDVLENMQVIRGKLNGDFTEKVNKLNEITKVLATDRETENKKGEQKWRRLATIFLFAFFFMFFGHLILSYLPLQNIWTGVTGFTSQLDRFFYWMIIAGFLAQLVDGALGMGYGVVCATVLLSLGINLPAISGSIHTAEMFSSGVSGYSHYKFGNVNKKLFKTMLIPGVIGAIAGAYLLSKYGSEYAKYIRPVLAAYTLFLGTKILLTAFKKNKKTTKVKRVGWLAGAGGFLDSFGGGGWGPLVTSTLISKGRTPRYVIGSVSVTEFFVTLASALTFFGMLGISHWQVILGLIIGGMLGAPFAARLAGKLPLKTMFILVGSMVIIWSLRVLIMAL